MVIAMVGVGLLIPGAYAATSSHAKDGPAAAIANRLARAGNQTFPMSPSVGYFEGNPIQPESGQQVYATHIGRTPFTFSAVVYKTPAQAAAMYRYYVTHVVQMGGDFHGFKMVRSGRVIYMALTATAPGAAAPAVPVKSFLYLIEIAKASL